MKIRSIVVSILLCGSGQLAFSAPVTHSSDDLNLPCAVIPKGMLTYGYTDFKFNSNEGANFYNYDGESNSYAVSADNLQLSPTLYAGLSFYHVDTNVNWQMNLASVFAPPGFSSTDTNQKIHSNLVYGHVLKALYPHFYIDAGAGYGRSNINDTTLAIATGEVGTAAFDANNWLANLSAIYATQVNNFDFSASLGLLYSQIDADGTTYNVPTGSFPIDPLSNRVTMLTENAELGYYLTPNVRPFVNGGLFEVLQYSNSRPILLSPVTGVLPQMTLDENGFRLGAGIGLGYNQVKLRVEEKYYNAGNVFTSWQTQASAQYQFD